MTVRDELAAWYDGFAASKSLEGDAERESLKWSSRKRVYLEGPTDYEIIAVRWFHSNSVVDFKSHNNGEGGCVWVINQVQEQKNTYGIVDRDILFNADHYALFFDTDDQFFRNQKPFGPNILVLSRHELENFLLDIPCLFRLLSNRRKNTVGSRSISNEKELCDEIFSIAETVMIIDAICSVFRLQSLPLSKNLGIQCFVNESAKKVYSDVEKIFEKWIDGGIQKGIILKKENVKESFCICYNQIFECYSAFDPGTDYNIENRLLSLFRIIDGKRFLSHFQNRFRLNDPFDFDLADLIANSGKIPIEIKEFLNTISNTQ